MSFTAGQALGAADLNDLDIDSLTVDVTTLVVDKTNNRVGIGTASPTVDLHVVGQGLFTSDVEIDGDLTLQSTGPRLIFEETDAPANHKFDVLAHEAGSWSVRSTDNNFTDDIKRIEIDGHDADTIFRVNNGSNVGKSVLRLKHSTGIAEVVHQIVAQSGSGSVSAPTFSFADDLDSGFFLSSPGDVRAVIGGSSITRWQSTYFGPVSTGSIDCGASAARWGTYFGQNADNISSDERLKVREGEALGLDFVRLLDTFAGRWADPARGDGLHQWLSAQNVAAVLEQLGHDPADSTLWLEADDGEQSLAYTEFIPPIVHALQAIADRVDALEAPHAAA